jgi:hypothetical protein
LNSTQKDGFILPGIFYMTSFEEEQNFSRLHRPKSADQNRNEMAKWQKWQKFPHEKPGP